MTKVEIGLLMATWVDGVELDLRLRTCRITLAEVLGEDRLQHVVAAIGIKLFRSFNEYPFSADQDTVLEATQVFLSGAGDDFRLFIECWGPDAGIEIVARNLTLDGLALTVETAASFPVPRWALT